MPLVSALSIQTFGEMMDTRIGKFAISKQMIEESPEDVRLIMGQVIVLDADYKIDVDLIEYTAICDQFAPHPRGTWAVWYKATVSDGVVTFR